MSGIYNIKKLSLTILFNLFFASFANAATSYKVKSTDSLSRIAAKFYKGSNLSRHQVFIGILAENPNAFRLGNINYLKRGEELTLPNADDILAMEPKDATRLVSEHNNATKESKVTLKPPFEGYSPKNNVVKNSSDLNKLAEKQQAASLKLQKLDSESEQLRIKLEQLEADKKAMDEELILLNNLIKE